MSIVELIEVLCNEKCISIAELERHLNFGNGTIRRWSTSAPNIERLKSVAQYFNVTVSFLIGESESRTPIENIVTIAAHHDGEDWTDEELEDIEDFKRFILSKRHKQK